jgi:hypothetical protein
LYKDGEIQMPVANVSCAAGQVSDPVQLNLEQFRNGVSVICDAVGVTGTFKVEVSNDPPALPGRLDIISSTDPRAPTHWADHDELVSKSADAVSNIAYPVQWVRLNCASVSAGAVSLGVAQGY